MSETLENAPEHIKLAVDLIMLFEQNEIQPQLVLDAIEIVKQDYLAKLDAQQNQAN